MSAAGSKYYSAQLPWAAFPFRVLMRIWGVFALLFVLSSITELGARYLYGLDAAGAAELAGISAGLVFFTTLPLVIHYREMVLYLLLSDQAPPAGHRLIDALADLAGAILFGIIAVRLAFYSAAIWANHARTLELHIPKVLLVGVVTTVAAFACLACILGMASALLRRSAFGAGRRTARVNTFAPRRPSRR